MAFCALVAIALLWVAYRARVRYLASRLLARLEVQHQERERIARELHDTLLQGVQGLALRLHKAGTGSWTFACRTTAPGLCWNPWQRLAQTCRRSPGCDSGRLQERARAGHWGVTGMQERAGKMGARLRIWSREGSGTEIEICLPWTSIPTRVRPHRHLVRWLQRTRRE